MKIMGSRDTCHGIGVRQRLGASRDETAISLTRTWPAHAARPPTRRSDARTLR